MNTFLKSAKQSILSFAHDEEGAQVVEYALIIAVVSIVLVIALRGLTEGTLFDDFIDRVATCLSAAVCT